MKRRQFSEVSTATEAEEGWRQVCRLSEIPNPEGGRMFVWVQFFVGVEEEGILLLPDLQFGLCEI